MSVLKIVACTFLATCGAVRSQSPGRPGAADANTFEVATIRRAPAGDGSDGSWSPPGIGRFTAHHLPLAFLIHMAYDVDIKQIVSQPNWLQTDLFDLDAKPEAGIPLTREQLRPMLQELLRDRFHLAVHLEKRQGSGFALAIAKGGPRLQPTKGDHFPGFRTRVDSGNLQGFNWSLPYLASLLQTAVGRPVKDETGIQGSFDINISFAPESAGDSPLPSLFTALRDTVGLELKPKQLLVDVLVIDHADRVPTDN